MHDSVRRIEKLAFINCTDLKYVKLSRNIEYIGAEAFNHCRSLSSMFIPYSCREIGECAFGNCYKLIILYLPQRTELGGSGIYCTKLIEKIRYNYLDSTVQINAWIKSINDDDEYGLHRLCSSMDPSEDEIYQMICDQGVFMQ